MTWVPTGSAQTTFTGPLSSKPISPGVAVAVGDLIVVASTRSPVTPADDLGSDTCADNLGNSYGAPIAHVYDSSNVQGWSMFASRCTVAGTPTITISYPQSSNFCALVASFYTGAAVSPLDGTATGNALSSGGTDGCSTGAIVTTHAGDLVVAIFSDSSASATITAGTNFTARQTGAILLEDLVQGAAGSITPTCTFSNTDHYIAVAAAFAPLPAAQVFLPQGPRIRFS